MSVNHPERLRCSFCQKDQNDVRKLIAGPSVFICDECVDVCVHIIADEAKLTDGTVREPPEAPIVTRPITAVVRCSLCGMPAVIEDVLPILNRGALCPGCIGEIQAAVAERTETADEQQ